MAGNSRVAYSIEPLSWGLLAYWKRTHPDDGPSCVLPAPIVVARRGKKVVGFGALAHNLSPHWPGPVIQPLYADNVWIAFRLLRMLEAEMVLDGHMQYYFYTKGEALVSQAMRFKYWTRLMDDEEGRVWFSGMPLRKAA